MGPLAHGCAYRVGTTIDPLAGSTFHKGVESLRIQTHCDGCPWPLSHRRTAGTRRRQLGQVIAALSLISPRLNLLVTNELSMKKTLTHTNIVYEIHATHGDHPITSSSLIDEIGAGLHGRTHDCAAGVEERAWWLLCILYVSCRFCAYPETVGRASNDGGTPQGTSPWRSTTP